MNVMYNESVIMCKNELLSQLYPTFPQVLCFSKHHMNYLELQQIYFDGYSLGT
jgi:hypothetical protein